MLTCLAIDLVKKRLARRSEACKGVHGCPAENCIVVAEGVLQHSGTFKVRALGFPPVELRGESRAAAKVSSVACFAAQHSSSVRAHMSMHETGEPCDAWSCAARACRGACKLFGARLVAWPRHVALRPRCQEAAI